MLTIRFTRVGKKNKAQFKIALQEHTVAPGGRHVEILGSYDPHSKQAVLKEDRIKYWLEKGAQASDTVYNLLVSKGIISAKKRAVKIPAKKVEETPAEAPKVEVPKEEVKTEEAKKEDTKPEEKKVEEVKKEEIKPEEKKPELEEVNEVKKEEVPVEEKQEEVKK